MVQPEAEISVEELREILRLDPETGKLYWLVSPNRRIPAGSEAGCSTGIYRNIGIRGRTYYVHRVVFALTHGRWPEETVDHEDRSKRNNQPDNLRDVSMSEQRRNTVRRNRTGFRGVHLHRRSGLYHAEARADGKKHSLGYFREPTDAARAYDTFILNRFGPSFPTNKSLGLIQ